MNPYGAADIPDELHRLIAVCYCGSLRQGKLYLCSFHLGWMEGWESQRQTKTERETMST